MCARCCATGNRAANRDGVARSQKSMQGVNMQSSLRGKTALITGGSRGIGRAIALGLASRGASVAIGYVNNATKAHEVAQIVTDAGGQAVAIQADLSRPSEVI